MQDYFLKSFIYNKNFSEPEKINFHPPLQRKNSLHRNLNLNNQ